ncbi:MAG: AAA family ATPase, partial [Clostridia bacterium]|nr:AAA family ATPase [Clostridia bacterium]
MLCSRCQKRPAVVFITRMENDQSVNEGLCLPCAKELGIKPVDDLLNKMGMSSDDVEQMEQQLEAMMPAGEDSDDFEPGGAATFPPFLQNIFGKQAESGKEAPETDTKTSRKDEKKDKKRRFLSQYCTNLTEKAFNGSLDAVIGREKEIYRVVQILSRRTKNNPCLIGEPGVGKTAIAEGLALKIASGEVPELLRDKRIVALDLTGMVAGTKYRGDFEERIKGCIDEVIKAKDVILFIDEVHNL